MSNNISPAIAPSPIASSPNAAIKSSSNAVTKIVTSKEWVLPPRPKPGRKRSADTPATKRKAQNRDAQRAFRERRATRVQELEEKLNEVEKEKETNELNFKSIASKLDMENKFLMKTINDMKAEFTSFKQQMMQQTSTNSSPLSYQSYQSIQPQQSQQQQIHSPSTHVQIKPRTNSMSSTSTSHLRQQQPISPAMSHSTKSPREYAPIKPASNPSPRELQQQYTYIPTSQSPPRDVQQQYIDIQPSQPSPSSFAPIAPQIPSLASKLSISSTESHIDPSSTSDDKDCGVCVKDDCICTAVGLRASPPSTIQPETQKTIESLAPVPLKRKINSVEIDYTTQFSKKPATGLLNKPMPKLKKFKKKQSQQASASGSNANEAQTMMEFTSVFGEKDIESPFEQCGFCSDDSPCVCREAAKEAANVITELQTRSKLPPISRHSSVSSLQKLPVFHPGPSVEISTVQPSTPSSSAQLEAKSSIASVPASSSSSSGSGGGCTGNPGTCNQCQMDPMSTLFCTTIASKAEEEQKENEKKSPVSPPLSKVSSPYQDNELNSVKPSTISINTSSSSKPSTPAPSSSSSSSLTSGSVNLDASKGIYIPCADAYKTLSRHKGFNSVDFGTLVGKLTTRGMQVEVRSVANVLRELDKKVYN